jgi:hypothetical protein
MQTKRLALEQRREALISRDRAVHKAFNFARTLRDAIQAWAARAGPQLAAAFDLDAAAVTIYLEDQGAPAAYRARRRARRILTRVAFRPGFTQRGCTRKGLESFP